MGWWNQTAKENIKKAQAKQKKRYDTKHKKPVFNVGDKVSTTAASRQDKEESWSLIGMVHMKLLNKQREGHTN